MLLNIILLLLLINIITQLMPQTVLNIAYVSGQIDWNAQKRLKNGRKKNGTLIWKLVASFVSF